LPHGQNPQNHAPVPDDASMPDNQRDKPIKAIRDNWAKNAVFADGKILAAFEDKNCFR